MDGNLAQHERPTIRPRRGWANCRLNILASGFHEILQRGAEGARIIGYGVSAEEAQRGREDIRGHLTLCKRSPLLAPCLRCVTLRPQPEPRSQPANEIGAAPLGQVFVERFANPGLVGR